MLAEIAALTLDHLVLVLVSVGAAIVLGIPMGIAARATGGPASSSSRRSRCCRPCPRWRC